MDEEWSMRDAVYKYRKWKMVKQEVQDARAEAVTVFGSADGMHWRGGAPGEGTYTSRVPGSPPT